MAEKIVAAFKTNSWIFLVAVFVILIAVGMTVS